MAAKQSKSDDAGQAEVQAQADVEVDQGFAGTRVDPTPLENYTVAGVTSGKPTPETDEKAAETARSAQADVSASFDGPSKNQ